MISAVYDVCFLYSATLRDFLLYLAEFDLIIPFWSQEIHAEWMRNLSQNQPHLDWERLERTRRMMEEKFPASLVTDYEYLIPTLNLPDPNDRHVLAAAIHADADFIATQNLRDFPETKLRSYQIKAISPDEIGIRLIDYDPQKFLFALAQHRASLSRPPKTVEEYLQSLEKQGLRKTVTFFCGNIKRKYKREC